MHAHLCEHDPGYKLEQVGDIWKVALALLSLTLTTATHGTR